MNHQQVVAYVQEAKQFFDDYVSFLQNTANSIPNFTRTDTSYYFYVLTQIANANATKSQVWLTELLQDEDRFPPHTKATKISDLPKLLLELLSALLRFITGRPRKRSVESPLSEELQTKLSKATENTTKHLLCSLEMLQTQIANIPPEENLLKQSLINLRSKCDSLLTKNNIADQAVTKSWLNNALRVRGAGARIRTTCRESFSVNKQLKELAAYLNQDTATRTTKEKVDDQGVFLGNGFGALYYRYAQNVQEIKGSLRDFVQYASKVEHLDANHVLATIRNLG